MQVVEPEPISNMSGEAAETSLEVRNATRLDHYVPCLWASRIRDYADGRMHVFPRV